MKCPKCGYIRKPEDTSPDYECPRCGVIYAKYSQAVNAQREILEAKARGRAAREKEQAAASGARQDAAIRSKHTVSPKTLICTECGTIDSTKTHTPGSIWIEILLWCFLLLPGVIYTIWRHTQRGRVCASCGDKHLIPVGSPKGRALLAEVAPELHIGAR